MNENTKEQKRQTLKDIEQTFLKLKKQIEQSPNPNHPAIMALNTLLPEKYRVRYDQA